LPPFKEWFEKFCLPNQKLSKEDNSLDSSSLPLGKVFVAPEREKGIDREYFQDMMTLVGQAVESKLKNAFKSSISTPENSCLKIEVKWYRKSDQLLSNPSNFRDNSLDIEAWIEEKQTQHLNIASIGSTALEKQRESRKKHSLTTASGCRISLPSTPEGCVCR